MAELPEDVGPLEAPPRRSARMRALTGVLLLGALAGAAWQFAYWEPRLLPIRVIEVQGELHQHSSQMLQQAIGERLKGGVLTADLMDLKQAADSLSWVGDASIRRVWPDRLQVRVQEHKPLARWNGTDLVTAEGLVFQPRGGVVPVGLPTLEGDNQRAPEVVARYLQWRDDLMLVGHLIDTLAVGARGAWSLDLVSGIRLELGSEHVDERLRRFLANATQLEAAGQPKIVDLRYSNGFAVTWRRSSPAAAAQAAAEQTTKVTTKAVAKPKAQSAKSNVKGAAGTSKGSRSKAKTATKAKSPTTTTGTVKAPRAAQTQTDRTVRSANGG
ncbi:MAG: cell division protein FtsQ/DivIB [Bdellovibrio bacteriovorus]